MSSKFRLRRIFYPLVKVMAKGLIKIGVSPNLATCIMLLFSLLSFFLLVFFSSLLLFSIFVFLTGLFDGIDGAIARLTNKSSAFGGFFDSIMDRISEFVIFLALLLYSWQNVLWNIIDVKIIIIISFIGTLMISYLRARGEVIVKGNFDFGLMARSERLFYLFITMLLSSFIQLINEFLFVFMILVLMTVFFRFFKIYKLLKSHELRDK
ncbi:MAG: CDP-alcohol phosphatidyltransferase family protein [Promethearchaeota archaeon]